MTHISLLVRLIPAIPFSFKKESEQVAIYNQEAGRIEEDEVYDDFFAFLNDLYNLLGIEG